MAKSKTVIPGVEKKPNEVPKPTKEQLDKFKADNERWEKAKKGR